MSRTLHWAYFTSCSWPWLLIWARANLFSEWSSVEINSNFPHTLHTSLYLFNKNLPTRYVLVEGLAIICCPRTFGIFVARRMPTHLFEACFVSTLQAFVFFFTRHGRELRVRLGWYRLSGRQTNAPQLAVSRNPLCHTWSKDKFFIAGVFKGPP